MFLSKVRYALIVVLAVGIAGAGTGFFAHGTSAIPPSSPSPPPLIAKAEAPAQPNPNPPAQNPVASRPREQLSTEVDYSGIEDARATLSDALDQLSKRYNLTFDINEKAFEMANRQDAARTEVCDPIPLPPMRATLSTVLHKILQRVRMTWPDRATYLIRRDRIEITTETFVRAELGIPASRPLLPLVSDTLQDIPIAQALHQLADKSGYNIVIDPRIADKLRNSTNLVELNNVPVDSAVRLVANMAGMSVVRLDNVLYVTTADNTKHLREEQAQINAEKPVASTEPPKKPVAEKPKK